MLPRCICDCTTWSNTRMTLLPKPRVLYMGFYVDSDVYCTSLGKNGFDIEHERVRELSCAVHVPWLSTGCCSTHVSVPWLNIERAAQQTKKTVRNTNVHANKMLRHPNIRYSKSAFRGIIYSFASLSSEWQFPCWPLMLLERVHSAHTNNWSRSLSSCRRWMKSSANTGIAARYSKARGGGAL